MWLCTLFWTNESWTQVAVISSSLQLFKTYWKTHFLNSCRVAARLLLCHMSNLTQNSTQQQHVKKTREKVTHEIFERLQNIVNYLILHLHSETMWFCTKISYFSGLITKTHRQPWNLENSILTMSGNFGFVILCMVFLQIFFHHNFDDFWGRIKVLKRA